MISTASVEVMPANSGDIEDIQFILGIAHRLIGRRKRLQGIGLGGLQGLDLAAFQARDDMTGV